VEKHFFGKVGERGRSLGDVHGHGFERKWKEGGRKPNHAIAVKGGQDVKGCWSGGSVCVWLFEGGWKSGGGGLRGWGGGTPKQVQKG